MTEENLDIASEKVIKIILVLFFVAYALLVLNMANLMTPVMDSFGMSTTAIAPTIECFSPQNLDELLKCAEGL